MKTKRFTAQLLILLMLPMGMQAQEHIEQAFRKFIRQTKVSKFEIKGNEPGKKGFKSYQNTYTFSLPAASAADISTLCKAFETDEEQSYNTIRITDGDHQGVASLTLANHSTLILGEKYDNLTLMCYADPNDSTMRYAYALEWNSLKDGQLKGRIVTSYSRRPKDKRETTNEQILRFSFPSFTSSLGSKDKQSHVVQHIDKALTEKDVQNLRKRWNSKSREAMEKIQKKIREGGAYYVINDTLMAPDNMDSATWLAQFNAMKNLTERSPDSNTTPYKVSTLYDLCKHSGALDSDARAIVHKELLKLIEIVKDPFQKDLLRQSAENLKNFPDHH